MTVNPLILLVGDTPRELDFAFETLRLRCPLRVVRVERPATACARIGGGGVDAVVMHAAPFTGSALEGIAKMHRAGPDLPILAVYSPGDERAGEAAVRSGAAASLPIDRCAAELGVFLGVTMASVTMAGVTMAGVREADRGDTLPLRARTGTILAFLGSKGGVGTTTVALNAAALLARQHRVILLELRPQFSALYQYFRSRPAPRDLSNLLAAEPPRTGIAEVHACLWQSAGIHGLRVLFGPRSMDEPSALTPAHVRVILDSVAQLADYVVLDLPPSCSEANRAAMQLSHLVAMVLERDPICLTSAKAMLEAFEKWHILPELAGAIIVNRVAVASPFDLSEAEARLGIPLFAVIPPAPELCLVARQALMPLVEFDPESLAAGGFCQLLPHLSIRATAVSTPRP